MSLDDLKNQNTRTGVSRVPDKSVKRSYAWLLPTGLVIGFVAVFALLFGERLLPAREVQVAPVVTKRTTEPASQEKRTDPDAVESGSKASRGVLLFQASGWIEPDPYTTFVPTLINGVVEKVYALEGDSVQKGELLATLVDEDVELDLQNAELAIVELEKKIVAHCVGFEINDAEVAAAKLNVEAHRTQLDDARDHYERLTKLSAGSVARQQIVQAKLAWERQEAMLAAVEAEIPRLEASRNQLDAERAMMDAKLATLRTDRDRAQLAVDRTKISAPMDGVVLRLHAAPGKKRMLDMDDPTSAVILELYDPDFLQARIDVPLNEAAGLSVGQSVELSSDLLSDRVFAGTVTRITGQADLQRNTLQAKVKIHDPDSRLRPDMLVRAKFFKMDGGQDTSKAANTTGRLSLYIPESAIVGGSAVWVVAPDQTAEKRAVSLGSERREGHRLVLDGVLSGELVVLPPHGNLNEGDRLRINLTQ